MQKQRPGDAKPDREHQKAYSVQRLQVGEKTSYADCSRTANVRYDNHWVRNAVIQTREASGELDLLVLLLFLLQLRVLFHFEVSNLVSACAKIHSFDTHHLGSFPVSYWNRALYCSIFLSSPSFIDITTSSRSCWSYFMISTGFTCVSCMLLCAGVIICERQVIYYFD